MAESKIHFLNAATERRLSDQDRASLERLAQHTVGLIGIDVYPNVDMTDEDNIPNGIVLYMEPSAKVDPTLIHDSLFHTLAISKVQKGPFQANGKMDDAVFSSNKKVLSNSVPQFAASPARAEIRQENMKETAPWNSELGGQGSFLGTYYKLADNHRDKDYYIAASGTVPLVVQDLKGEIRRTPDLTYRQLMSDPEWNTKLRNGQYWANRNVCRNIAEAAHNVQVAVARIPDLGARLPTPDHAHPTRAQPEFAQVSHTIRDATWNRKPVVAIYSGVTPRQQNSNKHVFVAENPYDGIAMFPLTSAKSEAVQGFAADSGRRAGTANAKVDATRTNVCDWQGGGQHPDMPSDAWHSAHSDHIKDTLKASGWNPEDSVHRLVPIYVKLYNPALERNVK